MALLRSLVSTLKKGLQKTQAVLTMDLRDLVRGRVLDDALIDEIRARLLKGDVGPKTTDRLIEGLRRDVKERKLTRGEDAIEYLKRELSRQWPAEERGLRRAASGPTVVLVTGVNGAGKTTSVAKLCALLRSQGHSVLLAACDTFRAGAVRQLEIWAERLGVSVVKGQQGGDPAAVAFDAAAAAAARGVDFLVVDTAGRLQTQDPLMRQLAKIRGVLARRIPGAPHETLLVLDATAGQNALRQAEEFNKALGAESGPGAGLSGIFLAKLDGTAKGGIVVAIHEATRVPVKFIGTGETPEDVEPFDPAAFVEALFAEPA
ncbi:MAG: signal recognition particle-docking protein FtsY [Phycisphaerae bacterium]|nr:signal recognition particle-docking protein FtsY [Phycisphaerae bacterium]